MSETKFTKGEWKIQDDGYGMIGVILKKGLGILIGRKSKETQANAHLIATAPDMYELLSKINNIINSELYEIELADAINGISGDIDSLLAKARGEK